MSAARGSPRLHSTPLAGRRVVGDGRPAARAADWLVGAARGRACTARIRAPRGRAGAPRPCRCSSACSPVDLGRAGVARGRHAGAGRRLGRRARVGRSSARRRLPALRARVRQRPRRAAAEHVRPSACSSAARSEISEVDIALTLRSGDRAVHHRAAVRLAPDSTMHRPASASVRDARRRFTKARAD